jgi:D-xylose 1-dehydrogenase (NADP+, D-xylono-1,5-lactone-forming)
VLGAAWIAAAAVLPAIAASKNGRLVAIGSRDQQRAQLQVDKYPGARPVGSYDAVLSDPQVDAVYIPLVNSDHKEWTMRALAAGKHVLCEKPIGMNAEEAEEMAAAAVRSGKHLMEAFMYRFNPRTRRFVEALVDPTYLHATFGFLLKDESNYRFQPELGGGALLDVGCYGVSVMRWILGEPTQVFARSKLAKGVDMTTFAMLEFEGGQTASVWASIESAEVQWVTVVVRDGVRRLEQPFTSREEADSYQLMVESFADSVLHDRPVAIPLSESIANMKVLDRIREAASSS